MWPLKQCQGCHCALQAAVSQAVIPGRHQGAEKEDTVFRKQKAEVTEAEGGRLMGANGS